MPYSDVERVCGSVRADFHRVSEGVLTEDGDLPLSTDYNLYTNSQLPTTKEINALPLKTVNGASVLVADVGHAEDAQQIQVNLVRVDRQKSVYLPVMKQGGDTNTIAVVDGVKKAIAERVRPIDFCKNGD